MFYFYKDKESQAFIHLVCLPNAISVSFFFFFFYNREYYSHLLEDCWCTADVSSAIWLMRWGHSGFHVSWYSLPLFLSSWCNEWSPSFKHLFQPLKINLYFAYWLGSNSIWLLVSHGKIMYTWLEKCNEHNLINY